MRNRGYTDEQIIQAVKDNKSIAGVLKQVGLKPAGGNYLLMRTRIESMGLSTSHFTGKGWSRGKNFGPRKTLEEILESSGYSSHSIKLRLLKEGIFEKKCYCCGLVSWQGVPIPLELEHKDGNRRNNKLENLTLLCPNCHALTPTYRGKNIGSYKN